MPRQVIVWECEFCNKKRNYSKTWIEKHENSCMANPKSKNCYKCRHYTPSNYLMEGQGCELNIQGRTYYTALKCEHYEPSR